MDWTSLREQFPVTRRWAYFDHAAVAPIAPAQQALAEWAADLADNGEVHDAALGASRRRGARPRRPAAQRRSARRRLRQEHQRGHRHRRRGLPLAAGRQRRHRRGGVPRQRLSVDEPARAAASSCARVPSRGSRVAIDDMRAAIDGRTRIVSLSWVEFASGFRNDLDALGELCRRARRLLLRGRHPGARRAAPRRVANAHRRPGRRRAQVAAGAGRGGHLLHPPRVGRAAAPGRRRLEQRRRRDATSRRSTSR